ncbi:MAG: hypothetical protein ACXABY_00605 [Candidatus Thorarchaeota archaeon]|jgi:hypothetical protein
MKMIMMRRVATDAGPFRRGEDYLFLGEIKNMRDHGAFVTDDGLVRVGWHIADFMDLTEDET